MAAQPAEQATRPAKHAHQKISAKTHCTSEAVRASATLGSP